MRKGKRRNKFVELLKGNVFAILLFLVIIVVFTNGLKQASAAQGNEALRVAEDSLRRAVVSCYAIEGSYPESYNYVKENYNVGIDDEKYAVYYEIFASNIMPNITIVEK